MASIEDLEARVAALEADVRAVRQDAAAARVLAGGADRDVSAFAARLDAQRKLLQALRETQIEHTARLDSLEQRFGNLEQRVGGLEQKVDQGFDSMREVNAKVLAGQTEILTLLRRAEG
ncbi:hypothetical protein ACQEVB_10320 [Pseudonocardia sp. CA-107938]|uniref:hypothetical protein n=1 Tax=Pseudonocardia sp. CA-107938 TaxID=3240021 RepID=UPI003D8BFB99